MIFLLKHFLQNPKRFVARKNSSTRFSDENQTEICHEPTPSFDEFGRLILGIPYMIWARYVVYYVSNTAVKHLLINTNYQTQKYLALYPANEQNSPTTAVMFTHHCRTMHPSATDRRPVYRSDSSDRWSKRRHRSRCNEPPTYLAFRGPSLACSRFGKRFRFPKHFQHYSYLECFQARNSAGSYCR